MCNETAMQRLSSDVREAMKLRMAAAHVAFLIRIEALLHEVIPETT
jgi:methyl coenzyme M reductase alpha subunit